MLLQKNYHDELSDGIGRFCWPQQSALNPPFNELPPTPLHATPLMLAVFPLWAWVFAFDALMLIAFAVARLLC